MTIGLTKAVVVNGIDGAVVEVEAHIAAGLPKVTISGLPDTAISQAPGRIRAAMSQSDLEFPDSRLTLNLSPASLPKSGSGLDLALAVSTLAASSVLDVSVVADIVHIGELGMDGSIRPVRGVLPAVLAAARAGLREVMVPAANAQEAALVHDVRVLPVTSLRQVVDFHRARLRGKPMELPWLPDPMVAGADNGPPDLADVTGQHEARMALEVAAAGAHNLSMVGPPGAGKTMLAARLPSILPKLSRADALAVTSVQSVLGLVGDQPLVEFPPFIAPHHGSTMAAMVGGGSGRPKPGAVSQAHAGVLFLDEAPEFRREVLDALRQPLEEGRVSVARSERIVEYPCRFQLILARNPCPCGRFTGRGHACTCSPHARLKYNKRLSGPLMDRIDVHFEVSAVTRTDLCSGPGESSAVVAARVEEARERAARRWAELGLCTNAEVPGPVLRSTRWGLPGSVLAPLDRALDLGNLTLRGYDRTLRLAWTLCDLAGRTHPSADDVYRALCLRDAEAAT